jgi:hypothetical protein
VGIRFRSILAFAGALVLSTVTRGAHAQQGPARNHDWQTVTTITMLGAAGTQLFMPRIFYSDPEVTVGWKARWHVSVLAPVMTLTGLTLLNEYALKDSFKGFRPGCDETNRGVPGCGSYGLLSSHTFAAFAALGHGTAVFLVDTTKWSGGRFNAGAFVGNVALPLVLSTFTAVGRDAGNYERSGQVIWGGVGGLVSGFATGAVYALMQRPECGYTGSLICW